MSPNKSHDSGYSDCEEAGGRYYVEDALYSKDTLYSEEGGRFVEDTLYSEDCSLLVEDTLYSGCGDVDRLAKKWKIAPKVLQNNIRIQIKIIENQQKVLSDLH